MRYHLVTSLDINTWKKNKCNIVIGNNNLENNINFSKFQYKILNSSEVLGNSVNSKVEQINKIFSIAFPLICKKLNNFHNCDYSNRYWKIILGNWLFRCISVIVYRFNITKKILSKYNITSASIAIDQNNGLITKDSFSFIFSCEDQEWNSLLYGRIIDYLTDKNFAKSYKEIKLSKDFTCEKEKKINKFKKLIKDFFMIQLPNYFYNEKDALIIDSYLPKLDELKLNILLKQFPQRYKFPKIEYDYQLRREEFGEIDTISKDPIVKFFAKNLKYLLPICFVESYAEINNKLKKLPFPEKPKFIFTSNAYDFNEVFKVWAAKKCEQGYKYIVGQHGNNYNTHLFFGNKNLVELSATDGFFTWGWRNTSKNIIQGFNFKSNNRRKIYNKRGGLLVICQPKEDSWHPVDVETNFKKSLIANKTLLDNLHDEIKKQAILKYKVLDTNFMKTKFFTNNFSNFKIENHMLDLDVNLKKSRLVIFNYDSTGILELLCRNIPFIALLRNDSKERKNHANKLYQIMFDSKIFHHNPKSASKFINNNWNTIEQWWYSPEVIKAKASFCNKFSRSTSNTSKDLLYKINKHLSNI